MSKLNFTNIVLVIFSLYIINSLYVFYILFDPPSCIGDGVRCLRPKYRMTGKSNAENLMVRKQTQQFYFLQRVSLMISLYIIDTVNNTSYYFFMA